MVADATSALSDLQRQFYIQEILGHAAEVASEAVATASYSGLNITTATTTLVKTGVGILNYININKLGTVASTVKVYDGIDATGVLLATIDSLTIFGSFSYGISFATGLCVVSTGTAAPDITVVYK